MSMTSTDGIEREVVVNAPVARVWRALTDASEFSAWFGIKVAGTFAPGERIMGDMSGMPEHAGHEWTFTVVDVEPERLLSFRWHPGPPEDGVDYTKEPTTLVCFELTPEGAGTRLRVTETGFEAVSLERRARVFEMNSMGWTMQMTNIEKYLAENP